MGILKFSLKYVFFLAWPIIALVYPLWVSIRVIETKSNALMQKLIAYWISFSVILLFEYAFEKLIEWVSFWCYVRLVIIIFLVMHEFAGSLYVYEHIVRPCLSANRETLNIMVNEAKKPFNKNDTFLTQLEKYVKENGTETLENLISAKIGSHPGNDKNKINTVTEVEQPKFAEPKVASKDISAMEATVNKEGSSIKPVPQNETEALENLLATKIGSHPGNDKKERNTVTEVEQPKFAEPKVASKDISTVDAIDKKEGSSIKPISLIESKLPSAKTNAFAPPNRIGIPIQVKECIGLPNKPFPTSVQKEWTCALCHITLKSETDCVSHLQGRRHRAAFNKFQAKNQTRKMKVQPGSDGKKCHVPSTDAKKLIPGNHSGAKNTPPKVNKPLKKEDPNNDNSNEDSQWWCVICNIKCNSQMNFDSHLNGGKHLARIKGASQV